MLGAITRELGCNACTAMPTVTYALGSLPLLFVPFRPEEGVHTPTTGFPCRAASELLGNTDSTRNHTDGPSRLVSGSATLSASCTFPGGCFA